MFGTEIKQINSTIGVEFEIRKKNQIKTNRFLTQ